MNPVEAWFNPIYSEYHDKLVKLAFRLLGDEELAKDIANTAFLTLLTKYEEVREHPLIYGWLVKTVRNLIMSETQKARYSMEVPFLPGIDLAASEAPPGLFSVLPQGLTEDECRILCYFFEDRLSHEEIAARMGCSPDACRMRLHRAKEHCRKLMLKGKCLC